MKRFYAVVGSLLSVVASFAQLSAVPGGAVAPQGPLVALTGSVDSRQGDQVHGVMTAVITPTWHINSAKPLDEFVIPTTLSFDPQSADLVKAEFPPHELKSFEFSSGGKLAVYEGTIRIPFTVKLKSGAASIKAVLRYQACNDKVCLPPTKVETEFSSSASGGGASSPSNPAATPPPARSDFTPLSDAPKGSSAKTALFSSDIGGTFASRGLPLTLLAIFVLGLALNLTPCVYPLIPITIGFFAGQTDGRRSRRLALSSIYVLGMAITYSVLGVFSALSGKLFGAWLQLPAVLIFFALVMIVMASSMFGLFEITVPHFISDRSGGKAGLAGALGMGLLIGIVAAPCVGPFVISLIALVAQLASPLLGFLLFFVLALGLGVPYLVLGVFSSGLNAIPRSGMWMVQVKKAMGFILIAMAFYFLRPLTGEEVFRWGVAGSLLIGAAFLLLGRSAGPQSGRVMRLACAALLLVSGVAFAIPRSGGTAVSWSKFRAEDVAAASSARKPAIVDFYADWCMPCKELDEKTFTDRAVAAELGRFVRFKANLTQSDDPAIQELTKRYAVIGVPTIVLVDSSGREVPSLRLTGFEPPAQFLKRLQQVR